MVKEYERLVTVSCGAPTGGTFIFGGQTGTRDRDRLQTCAQVKWSGQTHVMISEVLP